MVVVVIVGWTSVVFHLNLLMRNSSVEVQSNASERYGRSSGDDTPSSILGLSGE